MKTSAKKKLTRTVKINDELHHLIRVRAVEKRVPMQELIERLLKAGLRRRGEKLETEPVVA
jgi:hypothetical protein